MTDFLKNARSMEDEIIKNRRILHNFAEVGFDLPQTVAFIMKKLQEYGYTPTLVGKAGVVATVGKPGKTILLRADTDALPMQDLSGLDFAATNGHCHSCGHDMHPAMLLGAAKLLKEQEKDLAGTVKLMFQPAEELLSGAKDMIEHGLLKNPDVDAAFGLHVITGMDFSQSGMICYSKGAITNSGDAVRIEIKGQDTHGSMPERGVDAINIAAHIIISLQEVIAREIPSTDHSLLLVGKMEGGTTCNSVAGSAVLEASIRGSGPQIREFLKKRVVEISQNVAATFRGKAEVDFVYGSPALMNDSALVDELIGYIGEILPEEMLSPNGKLGGGEDFTFVADLVPSAFFLLGAGSIPEGYEVSMHNPSTKFNESVMPVGAAILAECAYRWLEKHSNE